MLQEYGLLPSRQNPTMYTGPSLPVKPGGIFSRAPNTLDIDYPMGFEWQHQVSPDETDIYCRVPDSTVWQFLQGSSGGIVPVDEGGTGVNDLLEFGILVGEGTNPVEVIPPGGAGTVPTYINTLQNPVMVPSAGGSGEGWTNLGMALVAGTLHIMGENQTPITSSNPAFIKFNSKLVPGTIKTFAITSAPIPLAESDLTGATFGTTSSNAWGTAMPWFLYAAIDGSGAGSEMNVRFFCSRNPCLQRTPAAVQKPSTAASATSQFDVFFFDDAITAADFASSPCVRVGSFRMVKNASDEWTIQTLGSGNGGHGDGIGNYAENTYWVFPAGQNGAAANSYFSNADTTNPQLETGSYAYTLGNNGAISTLMNFTTVSVNGSGASNNLRLHTPTVNIEANISSPPGYFRMSTTSGDSQNIAMALRNNNTTNTAYYTLPVIASGTLTPGNFIVADDITGATYSNISFDITYQAFSG